MLLLRPWLRSSVSAVLRTIVGSRTVTTNGEAGFPFRFPLAEYPSFLLGLARRDPALREEWFHLLEAGEVIFDVGANIGFTTQRFFALLNGNCSIWAFEPIPRNLAFFRSNVADFPASAVHIIERALGDATQNAVFLDNLHHGALSRVAQAQADEGTHNESHGTAYESVVVSVVTLDEFLADKAGVKPTFIKIDVEGAAGQVLKGAKETLAMHHPVVSCDLHSPEEQAAVCGQLGELGYRGVVFHDGTPTLCDVTEATAHYVHPDDARFSRLASIGANI